jgi:hypothetical protein
MCVLLLSGSGCASGDPSAGVEVRSQPLPLSFETPEGDLALAGEYDPENGMLVLEDVVFESVADGEAEMVLTVDSQRLPVQRDATELELSVPLQAGDELSLSAGRDTLTLVVQEPGFMDEPGVQMSSSASRTFSCGGASAKVYWNRNTGTTTAISIKSPSKDINDIVIRRWGEDIFKEWAWPVETFGVFDDDWYDGPSSGFVVLGSSSGWPYGYQAYDDFVIYWSFIFEFQGGGSCDTTMK